MIYKVVTRDPDDGNRVHWAGTKTEAEQILRDDKRDFKSTMESGGFVADRATHEPGEITPFEVPKTKAKLLKFLQHNTPNNDNG